MLRSNTNNKFRERLGLVAAVVLLIIGAFAVRLAADESEEAEWEEGYGEFARVFAEVYRLVETDYYEEREPRELFRAALDGMMRALDPHSAYMAPDSFKQLEKDTGAEFSGIGIHIARRDGLITVIAPIPGGPSALSGIQSWDRIIEIEGETTEKLSINDAISKITGPIGTQVTIKVWRPGLTEPEPHTLTRAKIRVENVFSKNLGGGIGLIRIAKFSDRAAEDMAKILEQFQAEGVRGLMVDLRFNSGGLLDEAVAVSELFLQPGSMVVSTRGRGGKVQEEHKARRAALVDWPMVILVNEGSASASEIFAAAMRDHKLAVLVGPKGQNTFGKGSVQTVIPQNYSFERDDHGNYIYGGYRLTTALYYTPSGETIHEKGITPDVGVEVTIQQKRQLLAFGLIGGPDMSGPQGLEILGHSEEEPEDAAVSSEDETASVAGDAPDASEDLGMEMMMSEDEGDEAPASSEEGEWDFARKFSTPDIFKSADKFVDVELEEGRKLLKALIVLEDSPEGEIDAWEELEKAPEMVDLGELDNQSRRAILSLLHGESSLPMPEAEKEPAKKEASTARKATPPAQDEPVPAIPIEPEPEPESDELEPGD